MNPKAFFEKLLSYLSFLLTTHPDLFIAILNLMSEDSPVHYWEVEVGSNFVVMAVIITVLLVFLLIHLSHKFDESINDLLNACSERIRGRNKEDTIQIKNHEKHKKKKAPSKEKETLKQN